MYDVHQLIYLVTHSIHSLTLSYYYVQILNTMKGLYFFVATLLFAFPSLLAQTNSGVIIVDGDQGGECIPLSTPGCNVLGYTMTYFPNFRGHETQAAAGLELFDYAQLIQSQCSDFILPFLCAYYVPICYTSTITNEPMRLMPCRSLCEAARENCSQVLEDNSDFSWPSHLDCSLDTFPDDGTTCFGETQGVTDSGLDGVTSDDVMSDSSESESTTTTVSHSL